MQKQKENHNGGFISKMLGSSRNNGNGLPKVNLRGLRVGFYPSKRDQGKLSIRFW